jgi:beta-glucanase (GH16 family)
MESLQTIQWSGYEWYLQEHWGQVHPEKPWMWYDPSAIEVDNRGYLHLKTKYNPKYFQHIDKTADMGVGLLSSTTKFYHGTYEIEAKLPKGKYLWPAFWLWGWYNWPPEIDVLEAYSNKSGNYLWLNTEYGGLSIWKVLATVHWREDGIHKSSTDTGWFGFKNPANNFIKYKLEWFPHEINIYYNNRLVKKVNDESILNFINSDKARVIINNGLWQQDNGTNSDFIVKYFTYQSL